MPLQKIKAISIFTFFVCRSIAATNAAVVCDPSLPQAIFAASELKIALDDVEIDNGIRIEMTLDPSLESQAYRIQRGPEGVVLIQGGDETGMMYGGLELAERIKLNDGFPALSTLIEDRPFIKQRGLKFNIPLDIRTPSYQDAGDAAQNNIAEMWNFEFWRQYLDMMARNRYNVLTLWNPHPFPSMIKLDDYPDIALEDVCGTSFQLDTDRLDEPAAKFIAGCGVSQHVMDNLIILKEITIEEKIDYWRKVMSYAKDRGVDIYFITWNIKLNSIAPTGWYREQALKMRDKGKYGINNDQENPRTIAYLRKAVKQFILTYPDLAGIGVTAGENMEDRDDEFDREKWLWSTYGAGVLDAKREQPQRKVKFIHRYWQSGVEKIIDDFISKYPDDIYLSFKYARARMYATPAPRWADEYIEEYSRFGLKSWWNIRNDDIFHFRWGDPEYASNFIKNLPPEHLTAGYFMGSDGYVWGREFNSVHPNTPRDLEIDRHWYNFMLWGRMGYNPDLEISQIKKMLHYKYPEMHTDTLYQSWRTASQIPSLVTRFHWHSWDFQWAVEGCLDLRRGFHTVKDFIENPTMDRSGLLTIPEYVQKKESGHAITDLSPLDVADNLDSLADKTLSLIKPSRKSNSMLSKDLSEVLYDLEAWSYLGKYYADKIRGALYFHSYNINKNEQYKEKSIESLTQALVMWRAYAKAATSNYRPQFMAKTRMIDWIRLTKDVQNDIEIVKMSSP